MRWIGLRKEQSKSAALCRFTDHSNFSGQEARQLAADGKTQSGAAVFPGRATFGLLECFEDDALLFPGDADTRIRHRECKDSIRPVQGQIAAVPTCVCPAYVQADLTLFRELECIGQKILENLLQSLFIRAEN